MVGSRGCDEQHPLDTVALFNSCCRCWPTRTLIPDSLQSCRQTAERGDSGATSLSSTRARSLARLSSPRLSTMPFHMPHPRVERAAWEKQLLDLSARCTRAALQFECARFRLLPRVEPLARSALHFH